MSKRRSATPRTAAIAGKNTPPIPDLETSGVACAYMRSIAREWREDGAYPCMNAEAASYAEAGGGFA
jgi:hypothetical protein